MHGLLKDFNIDLWGNDMKKVLKKEKKKYECIIVGFPDMDEFPASKKMTVDKYINWVNDVLEILFKKVYASIKNQTNDCLIQKKQCSVKRLMFHLYCGYTRKHEQEYFNGLNPNNIVKGKY